MSFDLQRILESKQSLRRKLAARPLAEKLAMLDALRERARVLRDAAKRELPAELKEPPGEYRVPPRKP